MVKMFGRASIAVLKKENWTLELQSMHLQIKRHSYLNSYRTFSIFIQFQNHNPLANVLLCIVLSHLIYTKPLIVLHNASRQVWKRAHGLWGNANWIWKWSISSTNCLRLHPVLFLLMLNEGETWNSIKNAFLRQTNHILILCLDVSEAVMNTQ